MTTVSRSVTTPVYSSLAVQHLLPTSSVTLESYSLSKGGSVGNSKKKTKNSKMSSVLLESSHDTGGFRISQ